MFTLTDVGTHAYSCEEGTTSGTRRDVTTWKERHDAAVEKQRLAQEAFHEASVERAQALLDGQAELGSQSEVARALGVHRTIVNRAIKALEKKAGEKPV